MRNFLHWIVIGLSFACGKQPHSVLSSDVESNDPWPDLATNWASSISEKYLWPDNAAATVWGGVQAGRATALPAKFKATHRISSSHFRLGEIEGIVLRQTTDLASGLQQPLAAPLMVVVPGLSADAVANMPRRAAYFFASRGYHVLLIPSPWSAQYIRQEPASRPGDLADEASALLDMVTSVRAWIGSNYITRIDIVGESYGGFLASVALATDAISPEPMIDGTLTAIGPPLDLWKALASVDKAIVETSEYYRANCDGVIAGVLAARGFGTASRQSDLYEDVANCSRSLMAHTGFHGALVEAAVVLNETMNLGLIPTFGPSRAEYLAKLRYSTFLRDFSPDALEFYRKGHRTKLFYWLKQAHDAGAKRFRVLLADDDFINEGLNPETCAAEHEVSSSHILRLSWGGHLGFVALPEFDQLLSIVFGLRTDSWPAFHTYRNYWLNGD